MRFFAESLAGIRAEKQKQKRENFLLGTRISENDLGELHNIVKYFDEELKLDFINVSCFPRKSTNDPTEFFALSQAVRMMNPRMKIIGSGYTSFCCQIDPISELPGQMQGKFTPDFMGFGRQIIADPHMPKKLLNGENIDWCNLCNSCFGFLRKQRTVYCKTYSP